MKSLLVGCALACLAIGACGCESDTNDDNVNMSEMGCEMCGSKPGEECKCPADKASPGVMAVEKAECAGSASHCEGKTEGATCPFSGKKN